MWKYRLRNGGHFVYGRWVNALRPKQNRHHFVEEILKCMFVKENFYILIEISIHESRSANNAYLLYENWYISYNWQYMNKQSKQQSIYSHRIMPHLYKTIHFNYS